MRLFFGAVALASLTTAQNSTYCTSDSVCYAVNVPALTASSGSGDIFFQISGPSTNSWIGLGQGSSMSGANIFMIYANSAGTNVTLSPRAGVGDKAPTSGSTASVTLLGGSGITNGVMVANVKCSNCKTWTGGSMSFIDTSSEWIWAYKKGSAISSDSLTVALSQHSKYGTTILNLQNAVGGTSVNPFLSTVPVSSETSSGGSSNSGSSGGQESTDAPSSTYSTVLLAHAMVACLAFALFFPLGAMGIRTLRINNMVWLHAGWMIFTWFIAIIGMGLGIWLATTTKKLDSYHAIIGLTIVAALILQPMTGITHHLLFKRSGRPNTATYLHVWWGRAVVTLGIINGGFGLKLTDNSEASEIGYGIGAAIIWCLWMAVILLAFLKSRAKHEGEFGAEKQNGSFEMIRSDSPHRSPVGQSYGLDEMRTAQRTREM